MWRNTVPQIHTLIIFVFGCVLHMLISHVSEQIVHNSSCVMRADWEGSGILPSRTVSLCFLNNRIKRNGEKVIVCVGVCGGGGVRWSAAIKRYSLVLLYKYIVDTHMSGVDHNMPGQMAVETLNIQHYRPGLQAAAAAEKK